MSQSPKATLARPIGTTGGDGNFFGRGDSSEAEGCFASGIVMQRRCILDRHIGSQDQRI